MAGLCCHSVLFELDRAGNIRKSRRLWQNHAIITSVAKSTNRVREEKSRNLTKFNKSGKSDKIEKIEEIDKIKQIDKINKIVKSATARSN